MTEIAVRNHDTLSEVLEWSKAMSTGDMLPRQYRGNPANLMFACEYADALGIPRINALTSIHVIDGKPTASAELIASLVRKAGHRVCPINGVWGPAVFISGWFFRTVRRR
ncbi:hypothetical protein [Rhodococcus qingshengii]|uniref:hypothetical protein n=1 Tax=Rhodococcus qingshengii TaxID=334542 RepID=UPI00301AAD8C